MVSLYELSREQLAERVAGEPRYRVDQLWRALWEQDRLISEIDTWPKALRERWEGEFPPALRVVNDVSSDRGMTRKWVFELSGGATVETVLMAYGDRVTVCVSTQAGCAMGCTFCATGQAGFTRQLTVGEVIEQVVHAARAAAPRRLSNVVFMGMGEPLANYSVTVAVVRALHENRGLSARSLTVSTVGVAPAIERLAREGLPLTLAVSLHAANDHDRNELIPLNVRYPLERLRVACEAWLAHTSRRLSFEWALIDGVNDTARAARGARGVRPASSRARQSDSAQSDAGLPRSRFLDRAGARLSRRPAGTRRERDGATHTRTIHRRRVRSTRAGHTRQAVAHRHRGECARTTHPLTSTRHRSARSFQNSGRQRARATAPRTQAMPPLTTEMPVELRAATVPASKFPRRGPPWTTAIWMAETRPR